MIGLVFSISLLLAAAAPTTNSGDQTESRIVAAMAGFHRFPSSRSIEDLRATSRALFSAIDQRAIRRGDVLRHRRTVVAAYAQVLQRIDALSDPAFDPSELPSACVAPPREPDGRQLPACADPKDIQDVATRAQYVAAINANSAKIQRRNTQARIYLLGDETANLLELVLSRFRSRAPSDSVALDEILRRAGLSEARRSKIHSMF
ncbi:MAG TPA: hypothetical protein VGC72_07095 [Candidatus Elarobacter sp.]|jgi:hypothetical protein